MLASSLACEVHCVDRERHLVEAMGRLALPRCSYSVADMTALPFEDRSFDAVACVSVLEHVHRETGLRAICEMLRVTRDDGLVALTVDYRSLAGSAGVRKMLTRMARAASYLARGRPAALVRAATSPRPYDAKDIRRAGSAFDRAVVGRPGRGWGRVGSGEISRFWSAHREPGLVHDPAGRDYTSVGILLSRDGGVRSLMSGCADIPP
jgi:SAM-dependent methyltransferase